MNDKYDIILASYNGSKYIKEQVDSILASIKFCDIAIINQLIITDDNSTDNTEKIIRENYSNHPFIGFYRNELGSGVINNFQNGLNKSTARYIFLCDQDDIWHIDKIQRTMHAFFQTENSQLPFLIITNVNLVDEKLKFIGKAHDFLPSDPQNPVKTAYRSYGQGCSMAFNKSLMNKVGSISSAAVMHDWWILLIASNFGIVKYIETPLLDYRQHDNNVFGGNKNRKLYRYFNIKNQKKYIMTLSKQSKVFLEIYGKEITDINVLNTHLFFSEISKKKFVEKLRFYVGFSPEISGVKNKIKFILQLLA